MEDQEGNSPQAHQPVKAVQVEVPIRQARDRAQYVRQQKGHSWVVWWLLLGPVTLWIPAVYYSFSPNHYWHV
ncbi:membrane protein [Microbacterium phage Zayuliv]|nr:membrane protein [Microbacterium phage Zayuliv]